MEELRSILIELQAKLHAIVDRIQISKPPRPLSGDHQRVQSTPLGVPSANEPAKCDRSNGGPGCLEQFHSPVLVAFHKWARIVLSLFVDKVVTFLCAIL